MLANSYERLPLKLRGKMPQFFKEIYAHSSILFKILSVHLHFWITDDIVDKHFKKIKIFFILSIGRSGTKWLANLLNKDPKALVVHEPFVETIPHQKAFWSSKEAERYILKFRRKEIYLRIRNLKISVYGEVNSYLRRHCEALKKVFPNAIILHLVRDGRAVVRSMYSRETMLPNAYDTKYIHPKPNDPYYRKWKKMTRFEKLCWYWTVENEYLYECCNGKIIQFEKILSDYEYFKERILQPLGLRIPRKIWEKEVNKPRNPSLYYRLPHWKAWSKWMKEKFEEICGDVMRKCGYELDW
mgnify:CR=1 FL=1